MRRNGVRAKLSTGPSKSKYIPATCQLRGPPFAPSKPMTSCRSLTGKVALLAWHMSRSPEASAPSVKISMAEPPTTTSSTSRSAQSVLHREASLALLSVGSCSAVMSANADLILLASMKSKANGNLFLRQKFLHVADGVFAEMENARGEDGVGFAFEQYFRHVFEFARAAAGYHGHADRFADAPRDDEIETGFRAVGVNRVQN